MAPEMMMRDTMVSRAFDRCLDECQAAVRHYTPGLVPDYSRSLPPGWPGIDPPELREAIASVLRTGQSRAMELHAGTKRYRVAISPDDEEPRGAFAVIRDVSRAHEREVAIRNLLREVSHRSKNLLAIVQSVAVQTAKHSIGMTDFVGKFRGRLEALADTQDLVTASDWEGARLHSLVAAQLARLTPAVIEMTGDNPLLSPNAALHVGLALHELASNTLVYGGFGSVSISAEIGGLPGQRTLTILWNEAITGEVHAGAARFGTMLLERVVPVSVGGTADYRVTPERVSYRLTMPSGQFDA